MAPMLDIDIEAAVGLAAISPKPHTKAHHTPIADPTSTIHMAEPSETPQLRNRVQFGQAPRVLAEINEDPQEHAPVVTTLSSATQQLDAEDPFAKRIWQNLRAKVRLSWSNKAPQSPGNTEQGTKFPHYERLKPERVDDYPPGYPQTAAFLASDDSFANVRRFHRSSLRLLLHLQIEITDLEKQLDELDKSDAADEILKNRLHGPEKFPGWNNEQQELLKTLEEKFTKYADILLKHKSLAALGDQPRRNHLATYTWVMNESPFREGKYDFIYHQDDFVSLSGQSQRDRPMEDFIESAVDHWIFSWFRVLLKTKNEKKKTDDEYVHHYSPRLRRMFADIISITLTVGLLLIPVYILFLVPMSRPMMAVTSSIFLVAFSTIVSTITGCKVHEVLFGTAAYAAVIIMFLGNLNGWSGA